MPISIPREDQEKTVANEMYFARRQGVAFLVLRERDHVLGFEPRAHEQRGSDVIRQQTGEARGGFIAAAVLNGG